MTKVGVCDQLCVLNMTDVMEEHLWGASWPVSVEVTPEASSVVASISETDRWIMRKARRKGLTSGGAPIKMTLPETHPSPQDRWLWPPHRVSQGQEVALTVSSASPWPCS